MAGHYVISRLDRRCVRRCLNYTEWLVIFVEIEATLTKGIVR